MRLSNLTHRPTPKPFLIDVGELLELVKAGQHMYFYVGESLSFVVSVHWPLKYMDLTKVFRLPRCTEDTTERTSIHFSIWRCFF